MPPKLPIAVLISGSGTNLQALIDARTDPGFPCDIVAVVSDRPDIPGLARATRAGIPTTVIDWADHQDRASFTDAIIEVSERAGAAALVLAGFMRILAPQAIARFPNSILNTHPSLLPRFPGTRAIEEALEAGVTESGVTVHFVDELVDHGPIIAQRSVPVHDEDTVETLRQRIQGVEHRLYPEVVAAFGRGEITVDGLEVVWSTNEPVGPR
ncbi:MAG: phosphoribosylglycinamide formyltransferase [Acidimicrobiia bacterium]